MVPIRTKMLTLVLALSIVPNFIAGIAINYQFNTLFEDQAAEIATQFMRQSEGYLSLYLRELEQSVATAVTTDEFMEALRLPRFDEFFDSLQALRELRVSIDRTLNLRTDVVALDIYAANGLSQVERVPRFFAIDDLPGTLWFDRLIESGEQTVWAYEASSRSLVHGRQITDATTGEVLGYSAARIPTYRIEGVLRRSRLGVHEFLALYDATTRQVAGPSSLPTTLAEEIQSVYDRNRHPSDVVLVTDIGDRLMVGTSVGQTALRLVMFVESRSILRSAQALRLSSLAVFVLTTLLTILVWVQFSRRITGPLVRIADTMNAFREGQTMQVAEVTTNDEIGEVAKSYNAMLRRLNSLIREVYEEQLHRKEAEWSALKAQINPHFLNNTLNSIASLARSKGAPEITQMVTSLAKLFRIVLSEQGELIPLSQELEYVRQYLRIQEVRYRDRLSSHFDISREAAQLLVPSFVLQPLVENAIEHGFEPIEGHCEIWIRAGLTGPAEGERLELEVEDNGEGMDPERVRDVLAENRSRSGRIGLWNVRRRVQSINPEVGDVEVASTPGCGTTVRIVLPVLKGTEETHEVSRGRS